MSPRAASSATSSNVVALRSRARGRNASACGSSATAAQRSSGTRRRVPTTSRPSARLYTTAVPSRSNNACVVGAGSLARMRSAELTRDRMISRPWSVIRYNSPPPPAPAPLDPGQVLRHLVGARRHPQIVQPLVEPLVQLAGRLGADAAQLLGDLLAERLLELGVGHERGRKRRDQRGEQAEHQDLAPDSVDVQGT